MIYLVKLEDLAQRYTVKMHLAFLSYLEKEEENFTTIHGATFGDKIKNGAFLDATSTACYKATQIQEIAYLFNVGVIKDGDKFLIYDMWFPGIELIKYMAHFLKIEVKVFGIAHAGSWTPSDFVADIPWAKQLEQSWLNHYDKIFVGTEFHRKEMLAYFNPADAVYDNGLDNIIVTRLPFWEIKVIDNPKEKAVVFPGRPHKEKGITEFIDLVVADSEGQFKYYMTGAGLAISTSDLDKEYKEILTELCLSGKIIVNFLPTKKEFYAFLSSVEYVYSWPEQENWGYAMMEAIACGCYPLARNDKSYIEMFERTTVVLFSRSDELQRAFLGGYILYRKIDITSLFNGEVYSGVKNIIEEVKNG